MLSERLFRSLDAKGAGADPAHDPPAPDQAERTETVPDASGGHAAIGRRLPVGARPNPRPSGRAEPGDTRGWEPVAIAPPRPSPSVTALRGAPGCGFRKPICPRRVAPGCGVAAIPLAATPAFACQERA